MIRGLVNALGWAMLAALAVLLPLALLLGPRTRRRRFWCAQTRRDVEVEFEIGGMPGLRRPVAIRSCSFFSPPHIVRCRRLCLEGTYRRRWGGSAPLPPAGEGWDGVRLGDTPGNHTGR
jgi:hypothetical protein